MDTKNILSSSRKLTPEQRARKNAQSKLRRFELKCIALAVYGLVCNCCKEWRIDCLSIDHVDGNGEKHRANEPHAKHIYSYLRAKQYPPGYQTLCHNCNQAKSVNPSGLCPHELERRAAMNGYVASSLNS